MANFSSIPVLNPHTYSMHMGPGCEHGKPFTECGQRHDEPESKMNYLKSLASGDPLRVKQAHRYNKPNTWKNEGQLKVFADPETDRSCIVTWNKDGLYMDSYSHYTKVGSKHMSHTRPDLTRSVPNLRRREVYRDPSGYFFNKPFSTSSEVHGQFYHSPKMSKDMKERLHFMKYDWLGRSW